MKTNADVLFKSLLKPPSSTANVACAWPFVSSPPQPRSKHRVLVSCSGLGMGNASRVVAVLEALRAQALANHTELDVHVVAWGAGYRFLERYASAHEPFFQLHSAKSYDWRGRFGALGFWRPFLNNVWQLWKLQHALAPSLILLDSDYHFPAFMLSRCPIVYLGQAQDVVARARRFRFSSRSWREALTFLICERLDCLFQKWLADLVLVPCFEPVEPATGKFRRIPLIVRSEFQRSARAPGSGRFGLLLSGSGLERDKFLSFAAREGLEVISPDAAFAASVPTQPRHVEGVDCLFVQGGLSSISEGIAQGKFLVVFPLANHPEQELNARIVEQLGYGLRASLDELDDFMSLKARIYAAREHGTRHQSPVSCLGAEAAASLILKKLSQTSRPH